MRLQMDNIEIEPADVGVRELGFGQGTHGRPTVKFTCAVDSRRFWDLTQEMLVDFITTAIHEYEAGIDLEQKWLAECWEAGDLAPQLSRHPEVIRRLICEFVGQRFLMTILEGEESKDAVKFVLNSLEYLEIGEEVTFGGDAFVAVGF